MNDWLLSTAMGLIGDCRQLAHIAVGNRRQPLLSRLLFRPPTHTLSNTTEIFSSSSYGERWKIFFRGGKAFSTFRRLSAAAKLSTIKFPRALRGSELEDER